MRCVVRWHVVAVCGCVVIICMCRSLSVVCACILWRVMFEFVVSGYGLLRLRFDLLCHVRSCDLLRANCVSVFRCMIGVALPCADPL